jgi:hypothetical protein
LLAVAAADGREPTPAQLAVIDGLAALLLSVPEGREIVPIEAVDLAQLLSDPELRLMAAQLLVLVALVDQHPDERCARAAQAFCRALGFHPENLDLLHEVVQRRIHRSRHHMFRRFLIDGLRTGSITGDVLALRDLVRERHDHPDIAAPYLALERLPEDTFGNAFFHFYRNRGWNFPGEEGGLPTAYGFEVHDACHLLSGYDTTPEDEINVVAFQAGATAHLPWLVLGVNLVTFNSGLAYGPTKLLHYAPHEGNLDPSEFVRALDRGIAVRRDLDGDFDLHSAWQKPIDELRAELGIEGSRDVRVPG